MTRRVTITLSAVALIVSLAGCCGVDLNPCNIDLNPCNIDIDLSPCDTPSPCDAPSPCDPCAKADAPRPNGLPEAAQAGEAWCRVQVPAQFEEYEERVLVTPASTNRQWIEPVYEEQERKVCSSPARSRKINTPAEYGTESDRVQTCPARTVWKKIPCESGDLQEGEKQGDCWKLVEIPAQFRDVERRVLIKAATCRTETIPPTYKTVTEKVMVKPGEWKCTPVEATYKMVTRKRCTAPAKWVWRKNDACDVPSENGDDAPSDDAPSDESPDDGDAAPDADEGADGNDLGDAPAGK